MWRSQASRLSNRLPQRAHVHGLAGTVRGLSPDAPVRMDGCAFPVWRSSWTGEENEARPWGQMSGTWVTSLRWPAVAAGRVIYLCPTNGGIAAKRTPGAQTL
jgi:hypothetical protein